MIGLFPLPSIAITLDALIVGLTGYRWTCGVELGFQNAVAAWLDHHHVNYRREYDLGTGPIDFYFPDYRIGLELKVKGSVPAVLRQLQRYAQSSEIDALILLTGRATLAAGCRRAETLNSKPLHVIATWAGGL